MASRGGFLVGDGALRRKNHGKKPNSSAIKHNKPLTRKKNKPDWDDTVTDLNVHKATHEELRKRHEVHMSKNVGLVKKITDKENESVIGTPDSTFKRKQAILQEILYGQDKFQDVLAETDRTMSAVKDIFGDDPKKFLGFPNVTVAPNKNEESPDRLMNGPFADFPETPTHLSMLSDSIMRTPALNELSDEGSESSDTSPENRQTTAPPGSAFEPKLDLQRYRQFISHESAQEQSCKTVIPEHVQRMDDSNAGVIGNVNPTTSKPTPSHVIMQQSNKTVTTDTSSVPSVSSAVNVPHQTSAVPTPVNRIPSNDRENDKPTKTSKKTKTKNPAKSVNTSTSSSNSGLRSLEDLRKMVESLEDEIAEYEMETGRQPSATTSQTTNFSGYTSSLITAVTKLMKYLKETETQRKAEAVLRDQIMEGFAEQRTLIDALTNDILHTQEQYVTLHSQFYDYKQNTGQQLNHLQREMHTVLKSFEYHTIQSTINTLHSTKPIPLNAQPSSSHSTNGRVQHTKGDYIPVSAMCDETNHDTEHCNDMGIGGHHTTMLRPEQTNDVMSTLPSYMDPAHLHHTATQSYTTEQPNQHPTHPHQQTNQHPTYPHQQPNQHPTYPHQQEQMFSIPGPPIQHGKHMAQTNSISSNGDTTASINHGIQATIPWPGYQDNQQHYTIPWPGKQDNQQHYTGISENPQTMQTSSSLDLKQNGVHLDSDTPLTEPWNGIAALQPNSVTKLSHHHSWDEEGPGSLHHVGVCDGVLSEGVLNTGGHDTRDDSFLVKSLIKDPQATRQLRHRLHGIAMKQKSNVALRNNVEIGLEQAKDKTTRGQPSPHVHFKLPREGTYEQGPSHKVISALPENSPSISPIPEEVLGVPVIKTTGLKKGRQVVVNLPSVWSDVSSTVSV